MDDKIKMYFSSKRVSNSMLKLLTNPRLVKMKMENPEVEDEDKTFFRIGAAVDCLLTSADRFNRDFKVITAGRPYGLMGKFIDNLPPAISPSAPIDKYAEAYAKSGYKMPIEWVVSKFWKDEKHVQYYEQSQDAENVTLISSDEMIQINKIVELLLANPFTEKYFINYQPHHEIVHQVPIYFEYEDVECKALMDGVLIDHEAKVLHPFDLKTTGTSVYEFRKSFIQFGYFRQAAFYELAMTSPGSPFLRYLTDGYTIDDFRFIVVETKQNSTHPAIIYRTTQADRDAGLKGGTFDGRFHKGIEQLVGDYKWHNETDFWDIPRELYFNEGELILDVFK